MRRVCEKYAQSHEKRARRPCTNFASERPAGKDSETSFKMFQRIPQDSNAGGVPKHVKHFQRTPMNWKASHKIRKDFNGSHRVLRDAGGAPKDVKQFQRTPRDLKESQKISKDFKGSQRPSPPMQQICSFSSLFSSPS